MKQFYSKNYLIFVAILFFSISISAQKSENLWTKTTKESLSKSKKAFRKTEPTKAIFYKLDFNGLKKILLNAPKRNGFSETSNIIIDFPNAEGFLESFRVFEASVMEPELQEKHPNIRSYVGQSIENPATQIRFSQSSQGINAMLISSKKSLQFIDPFTKNGNNYIIYSKNDLPPLDKQFECGFVSDNTPSKEKVGDLTMKNANDGILRTYRLAIVCTGEYAQFHLNEQGVPGSATDAVKKAAVLSAMNTSMTRINGVYEIELGVRMVIVANNENIIFLDAATDGLTDGNASALISESQVKCDTNIGSANYDIGHLFSIGGDGLAGLGVVCLNSQKARGVTGISSPIGDPYDIDYVSHEMGHQFGANHTQNNACNRNSSTAMEPGSASTIMGYAGICAPNVQTNSDAYFHAISIQEMWAEIQTHSCDVETNNGNTAPTINALSSFTVPISTPLILRGNGSDVDAGNVLSYCWEQMDNQTATMPPVSTSTTGPAFRSLTPSSSPDRYLPQLSTVLTGTISSTWEVIPSVSRTMNFRLTVRDNNLNGANTSSNDMVVTSTASAGPFLVTSQASMGISWTPSTTETITWDVAGTTANGVDTANVNILLSIDGGLNFDTVLISNTPNDGIQDIIVPGTMSPNCRIMIEAINNIFYAVNSERFTIGNYVTSCTSYDSAENLNLAIPDNTGSAVGHIINIPDSKIIDYITVNADITHSYVNDLTIQIQHPNGTTFTNVWNRDCGSEDGIDITFEDGASINPCSTSPPPPLIISGTFAPASPLNVFSGLDSAGDWTIAVLDSADADTGVLNDWSIEICETTLSTIKLDEITNLSIFPNPNNGEFTVKLNSNSGNDIAINIYDIRGRKVFDNRYNNSTNFNEVINLGTVQAGIYLLNISDGVRSTTKKIVVK